MHLDTSITFTIKRQVQWTDNTTSYDSKDWTTEAKVSVKYLWGNNHCKTDWTISSQEAL